MLDEFLSKAQIAAVRNMSSRGRDSSSITGHLRRRFRAVACSQVAAATVWWLIRTLTFFEDVIEHGTGLFREEIR